MLAAQNLLAHKRYHDGVIHIVVGGIAVGDVLQGETPHESNDVRIGRLQDAVALGVRLSKLLNKCLDNNLRGIEHGWLPNWQMLIQFAPAVTRAHLVCFPKSQSLSARQVMRDKRTTRPMQLISEMNELLRGAFSPAEFFGKTARVTSNFALNDFA